MSHAWPPDMMLDPQNARRRAPPMEPAGSAAYSLNRSRTTSSNTFPTGMPAPYPSNNYSPNIYQPQQPYLSQPQPHHQRRSPSVNTFSTISSGGGGAGASIPGPPSAYRNSPSLDIRRSTSSRSIGGNGTNPGSPHSGGYVALLRKQKATVWCDRAQYEDPRLLAQQRAAKMRAHLEVVGSGSGLGLSGLGTGIGGSSGRTSTGLSSTGAGKVAAKIRHHGKPTVVGYSPGSNLNGVGGVPLRLSATEVEGEESDEDDGIAQRMHQHHHQHRRTGSSGRNSIGSAGRRGVAYRSSGGLGQAAGSGTNPQLSGGGGARWSPGGTPERRGSLADPSAHSIPNANITTTTTTTTTTTKPDDYSSGAASGNGKTRSFGSGSGASERLDEVPELSANNLPSNSMKHAAVTREKSVKSVDELKRRGSVDERTMTLTSGRLFIANPD
ncbi:hypothetical protein VTK26DRAFT_6095 [Humicola hyalothermophila]